jgi:hypothetical protein
MGRPVTTANTSNLIVPTAASLDYRTSGRSGLQDEEAKWTPRRRSEVDSKMKKRSGLQDEEAWPVLHRDARLNRKPGDVCDGCLSRNRFRQVFRQCPRNQRLQQHPHAALVSEWREMMRTRGPGGVTQSNVHAARATIAGRRVEQNGPWVTSSALTSLRFSLEATRSDQTSADALAGSRSPSGLTKDGG